MAWLNAQGNPVAVQPVTIQIDVPSEQSTEASAGAPNLIAIIMAVVQLFAALKSGDARAIADALQALIKAFMG